MPDNATSYTAPRLHRLKGWLGRIISPGHATCGNCGWSYYWGQYHDTMYSESRGCFPLCEICWHGMTPEQRLPFYRALFERWMWDGPNTHNWVQIRRAVMAGK